ncbi:MAG: T9SS type A sorting domain-containing protein [Rhodothermales bacterium]|nr:T9SS type A sorting domain-containing protein [Rhodothermales bacterium]MBO6779646.1 T9SS type A sorting domain-containing protein [Rhodothermales bacterium]
MHYRKLSLFVLAVVLGLIAVPAQAQSTGTCEAAIGEAFLDINNVRARILNNGNLFWRGSPHVYNVPKGGPSNAIFASGIWMGGLVNGQLRLAGSTYGPYEFWAGPLNDDGTPPASCDPYDRVWKVSKEDVVNYDGTGVATPDLQDWPTGLGAPTLDANGDLIDLVDQPLASRVDRKVNLGAGERPAILGDQMLWWIMNDRGNVHTRTDTPPMGVEAHVSAFAFNTAGAIGNTTFYKYRIFYKGSVPLEQTYMGIFSDPDLGNFDDDYVGCDTTLGMGFVYNADNDDEGGEGYGDAPPAAGYDFFQGPLVTDDGIDNDEDGEVDEEGERLKMTAFGFYNNGGGVIGDPGNGADMYNYMRGRWKDGQRFTFGGNGRDFSNIPTSFQFPGNPPEFWSEFNSDGQGTAIAPADRRFIMATGPFTIRPNDEQEIVFGIVTSFGDDNIDSVDKMKADDLLAQAVFDINFELPSPPAAPRVTTTAKDGSILIEWGYRPTDNNYLDAYNVIDPLLSEDVTDNDYNFEGYNVYQYASRADQTGKLLATYDKVNGIKRVIEGNEITFVTAEGNDTGVLHYHEVGGLTNYQTYYFGVQAYAYNATSGQKVYAGPINRFSVVPSRSDIVTTSEAEAFAAVAAANIAAGTASIEGAVAEGNIGNGGAGLNVINPAMVTGLDYSVEFFAVEVEDDGHKAGKRDDDETAQFVRDSAQKSAAKMVTTYDVNRSDGTKVFDGALAVAQTGKGAPEGIDVVQFDGLSLNIAGAPNGFLDFLIVANANGPLATPQGAAADWEGFPIPSRPDGDSQATTDGQWMIATGMSGGCLGGDCGPLASFIDRSVTQRGGWDVIVPYDWEIRFTYEADNYAWSPWSTGGPFVNVPYELWRTGIATPDDPSDDLRFTSFFFDLEDNARFTLFDDDHATSGALNDPYTDWIYWYAPNDETPGEGGYQAWVASALAGGDPGDVGTHTFGRMVFMDWNGGTTAYVDGGGSTPFPGVDALPEAGSVFRINTTKPNQPGDTFALSTAGLGARAQTTDEAIAGLEEIGITPNPYKGASAYEVSQLVDQVRFTNMPPQATIRVFSLNGTLITTLEKNSSDKFFPWDLTTEEGLPIASGMYIIHIDVPNLGEKVIKFGVVKKRVQLNAF